MIGDYKYAAQMEAAEIAEQEYGCDFYNLPHDVQSAVYQRGLDGYFGRLLDRAPYRAKERKGGT
jgi:hypothetical protein